MLLWLSVKKISSSTFCCFSWRCSRNFSNVFWCGKFPSPSPHSTPPLIPQLFSCVNSALCLNLVITADNIVHSHTHEFKKNAYLWWQSLFFLLAQLSFGKRSLNTMRYVLLLCVHVSSRWVKSGREKERKSWKWVSEGGERINREKKVFYLQNIFTSKHQQRREHEKMSHSAMH
jgi:hypothetical protein